MDPYEAGRRAEALHSGGFNCAESVLAAVIEQMGIPEGKLVPAIATCFGGGVARTREELCGALAGGLMAVGCALGRRQPGAAWDEAAGVAVEIRNRFMEPFGGTACGDILAVFGPDEGKTRCPQLSGATARLVCEVLSKAR